MINYLIVDDEPQARKLLQAYMAEMPNYHLIKSCSNAMEAYESLQTNKIDLMFLDIKMPLVSGTDFLRSLKHPPMVIFTTAFNKYAMEGYELNVIDYLLKPIALPRLINALEKVNERINGSAKTDTSADQTFLFVKANNKLIKIEYNEILLIEGMQNYVKIHLKDRVLIAAYAMKALEDLLPTHLFLRVQRSFIIPIDAIQAINGNTIEMPYRNIQIGVSYRNKVMRYINRQ